MTRAYQKTLSILIVHNIERVYGADGRAVAALRGVSFEAERGDFIALMGPSGCGKSTLLHILGGMDQPTGGYVSLDGVTLTSLAEAECVRLRRKKIGFVFQFFNLLPTLTVAENVALPLLLDKTPHALAMKRAREMLGNVGLTGREAHYPAELSGGEMQRTAVARAVVTQPELILADEPTGNLDADNGTEVMNLLARVNREIGLTIILATHSVEAAGYARRTLMMRDGQIEGGA